MTKLLEWKNVISSDVAPHMDNTTNGPMTRSKVKALHEKVTSLQSTCDLDTPLNGLLLHAGTLCILRIHLDDDPQWSRKDEQEKVQDDGEDDQEKTQEDGQEEEEGGGARLAGPQAGPHPEPAGLPAGLGRPSGRSPSRAGRPPGRPPS